MPTVGPLTPVQREALVTAGQRIVARQAQRMRQLLPSSGFATLEDLAHAVSAMGPQKARVVELLRDERNFEFAMNRTEQAREGIGALGFLNQYERGVSGGTYDPTGRAPAEAKLIGVSAADYSFLVPGVRPKYGYLRPSAESGVTQPQDPAAHYGTDTYVFKRSSTQDNVTFTPVDSLDSLAVELRRANPTHWDQAFIPWADRMLLAPSIALLGNKLTRGGRHQYPPGFKTTHYWSDYIELQFWGTLDLRNVERFEFSGTPPSGKFLTALRANGVKIFRKGESTEWTGARRFRSTS
jgi:hypothetical protein